MFTALLKTSTGKLLSMTVFAQTIENATKTAKSMLSPGWELVSVS